MDKLIIGTTNDYFPYSYRDGTKFIGFDIDLCETLGKHLNVEIEYQGYENVSDTILAIQKKEVDIIISGLAITKKRVEQGISFIPYGKSPYYSLVVNNEYRYLENWKELDNPQITIAVVYDTGSEQVAEEMFEEANISRYDNQRAAGEALLNNEVNAIVANENLAKAYHFKNSDKIVILEPKFKKTSYLGIGFARYNHDLMDKLWKFSKHYSNSKEEIANIKNWLINT